MCCVASPGCCVNINTRVIHIAVWADLVLVSALGCHHIANEKCCGSGVIKNKWGSKIKNGDECVVY